MNCGIAVPVTVIEKVLSRKLPKLSVARIVNVLVIASVTSGGVPVITPVVLIVIPVGNVPLNNLYVIVVAGNTADADKVTNKRLVAGNVPNVPAGVFQMGCDMLSL